jgi:hypothetical protein
MKERVWIKRRGLVVTAGLAMLGIAIGQVSIAGADLANGAVVPGAAQAVGPVTTGIPFSSGQRINVVVPANSLFKAHTAVNVVECSAPDGAPPVSPASCDGHTMQGASIFTDTDGSINVHDATGSHYRVFALPDVDIGDSSNGSTTCGITASTECILYIGQNQNDFTAPHVWSQPFFVAANAGDLGDNPGDGSAPPTPPSTSASFSTVTASPGAITADGKDASTITVKLLGTRNAPIQGKAVVLGQGSGHSTITPAVNPNFSDAKGEATFFVTDTTAESVTYTATDSTGDITLTKQAKVTFGAPCASAVHSQITADPSPAPGGTTTVTVRLLDQGANPRPMPNQKVALSGTGSVVIAPADSGVTNAHGVATFTASDATAENVTFTATDSTPSSPIVVTGTVVVTFGVAVSPPPPPPAPSQANSLVVLSRPTDPADGQTKALVIVTINDQYGNPVPGKTVTLQASPSGTVVLNPVSVDGSTPGVTDSSGIAEFAATDTTIEIVTFSATDATDAIALVDHPAERFVTPQVPPAATPEIAAPALLPLSALILGGIVYGVRRRRTRRSIPAVEQ